MTLPWIIGSVAVGVLAGPWIRGCTYFYSTAFYSTESGEPASRDAESDRSRRAACRARIRPYPLLIEVATGLIMAIVAVRATSPWELAALAWLVLFAVPLAFVDTVVRRLPNPLTGAAFAGTLALLTVAALTGHQPGHLGRAAIGAAALACFYLVLWLIRPGGMGLGDLLTELRRRSPRAADVTERGCFPSLRAVSGV